MSSSVRSIASFVLVALFARGGVSLAQTSDSSIVAWGSNDYGQCAVPSPNTHFVAVAAGYVHVLGLKSDGSIVAWGDNNNGECDVPSPNTDFVAVSAFGQSLGLKSDGSIVAWGTNWAGQCEVPSPNEGFVAVAAGGVHSLGLKANGSIVAWGDRTGYGDVPTYGNTAVPSPNAGFVAIAAGAYHSLGLKSDGSIVAWGGWYDCSQCTEVPSPNEDFVAVAAGFRTSFGLKSDGSIVAWGGDGYGLCDVPTPNTGFVAVAAGENHGLGIKANGAVIAWGRNIEGQCGTPVPNIGFKAVAAGGFYSLAIGPELVVSVYLASFTAARRDSEVLVRWSVSHAFAASAFHLWRQDPGSERVRLSETAQSGQEAYNFTDLDPPAGPADYWLQEITTDGTSSWHGPAHLEGMQFQPYCAWLRITPTRSTRARRSTTACRGPAG